MEAGQCFKGCPVTITAADDFYAFVDGWNGFVQEVREDGYVEVVCVRDDGPKTFLIPPGELIPFKA